MLGLSTVKISAKSVRSIEQPSTGTGRGLGAMAHRNKFLQKKLYILIALEILYQPMY